MADDIIENRVRMIRTTVDYDSKPASVTATSGMGAYATVLAQAKNKLTLIDGLTAIANATTKGVTLDTVKLKTTMCYLGGKIGQAVAGYANSANNSTLLAAVNYTEPKLLKLTNDTVDDVCEAIQTAGNANILVAGPFGYTATDVTDLGTAIGLFRTGVTNPRQAIITKAQAKVQIKALEDDVIFHLFAGQMDKMAYTLKGTPNAFFYDGHHQAREIIDLGSATGKIRTHAHDVLGHPLADVICTVYKTGSDIVVKKVTTNAKGVSSVTKLFGKYDVTWECADCQPLRENGIVVGAGKAVTRSVTMIPTVSGHPVIN